MSVADRKMGCLGCVGMTHLGVHYSAAFADRGFSVVCYDQDAALIDELSNGIVAIEEPGLPELLKNNKPRLQYTSDISGLSECDVIFIAYDVPTNDQGESDLSIIRALFAAIKDVAHASASLVLLSQVPLGFMRQIDFDKHRLFYQVETLIFGRAVERACFPERYIVGQYEPQQALPVLYQQLLNSFECPILQMRYESAELAKIAINMYLVSSVLTTNTLAGICEKIGADWSEIVPTLRLDKRIGEHAYLSPGLGITGGNLERDLTTLTTLGKRHTSNVSIIDSWVAYSHYCREWVWRCLQPVLSDESRVCVLGLAYKVNTNSIKNSQSLPLIEKLKHVVMHDPVVTMDHPGYQTSIEAAVDQADVVVIMTPWDQYRVLSQNFFAKHMRGDMIIDPFQALAWGGESSQFSYYALGRATDKKESLCSTI